MTSSPSQTFIILLIFCSCSIQSQDCSSIEIDYSQISDQGDSLYLNQLLAASETPTTRCTLQKISAQYFSQFDYQQAILFGQALENSYTDNPPSDSNLILANWEVLSNSYHEMGIPDSVLMYGKKLLFALDHRITTAPKKLPRILEIVAMSFADKLQYDLALEWVDLIGYHLLLEGMQDTELFAGMLYVKGVVRTMQAEIEDASKLMDSIQNLYSEHPLDSKRTLARAHTLQIRLNLFLGDQEGLVYHINKAEQLLTESQILDTATYVSFLLNKSYYYLVMEDPLLEKEMTEKALALSRDFKQVPVLWSKVMLFYGANLVDNNRISLASEHAESAVSQLSSNIFLPNSYLSHKNNILEFLSIQLYNLQIKDSTLNLSEKIWDYNNLTLKNLELKIFQGNENLSGLNISNEDLTTFVEKILFLWDFYEKEKDNLDFSIIYDFFENYKSYLFNYYKSKEDIYLKNSDHIDILNKEALVRNEILNLVNTKTKDDPNNKYGYKRKILLKRKMHSQITNKINEKYGFISKEIETLNSTSFSETQRIAKEKKITFVSYISYEDLLFSITIGPDNNSFNRTQLDSALNLGRHISNIVKFHSNTDSISYNDYVESNIYLYKKLIKPIETLLTQDVVIIPHSEIFNIPFSALISEKPTENSNFSTYDWLINQYNFSYTPSINSYIINSKNLKKVSNPIILAIAPEFTKAKNSSLVRNHLSKLTYNVEEVVSISKEINTSLLIGNKSTKENIIEKFSESNIIHFATHTILTQDPDNETNLVLSSGISDSFELVQVDEIFPKNNSTNLVVLSACNSGKGEVVQGEGKLTLANDFFKNGAIAVISNLWDASDYSMKEIFGYFYTEISKGESISNSLRNSQLNFLATMPNELKHPFYWAGLTSTGYSNSSLIKPQTSTLFLGILCLTLIIFIFYKLKN